jgi:hypothetical protein
VGLGAVCAAMLVSGVYATSESDRPGFAALAPYHDFLARRAAKLCGDFTPAAANALARTAAGGDCKARVVGDLAKATALVTLPVLRGDKRFTVAKANIQRVTANVVLEYHNGSRVSQLQLSLKKGAGRWYVATSPTLRLVAGCIVQSRCTPNSRTLIFTLGLPAVRETGRQVSRDVAG